jgi:hypothetical protein
MPLLVRETGFQAGAFLCVWRRQIERFRGDRRHHLASLYAFGLFPACTRRARRCESEGRRVSFGGRMLVLVLDFASNGEKTSEK